MEKENVSHLSLCKSGLSHVKTEFFLNLSKSGYPLSNESSHINAVFLDTKVLVHSGIFSYTRTLTTLVLRVFMLSVWINHRLILSIRAFENLTY